MPRLFSAILVLLTLSACTRSVPANVAAMVNGRAITYTDLEKQYQSQFPSGTEHTSDDQAEIQKLEVLRTLIDGEIMLQQRRKTGPDGRGRRRRSRSSMS